MKKEYALKIDNFIHELEKDLHLELFEEEYTNRYDSSADVADRNRGINPMNEEYILKIAKKREKIGVSKLGKNGLPVDNSSELYIKKMIFDYLLQKQSEENFEHKKKMNISSFFKKQL